MKAFLSLSVIVFIIFSCKKKSEDLTEQKFEKEQKVFVPKISKKFFTYDQIDYYKSDYDEYSVLKLDKNKDKSKIDKLRFEVVIGADFPKSLIQTDFLKSMDKIGYTKKEIHKDKFSEIDKIFAEKTVSESETNACIAVYRDVLVFKNEGKITGIAKICFNCQQHQIIGTIMNTDNFGQNGDYKKLNILLNQ